MTDIIPIVLLVLTLSAAVVTPIVLHIRLRKQQSAASKQLISQLDQNLGASVKLLEVRNYYHDASSALKRMLDAAYKDGGRARQDEIRKLIDRLDALKARVLDKSVSVLDPQGNQGPRRRRRRSRRPRGRRPPSSPGTGSNKPSGNG